jgi:DNA (cytosine-5)-methyltransferase 1
MMPGAVISHQRSAGMRALDLFCGAGGATKGLQLAGFHVTGIDHRPMPRHCGDAFIQADALNPPVRMSDFDFIWASPPCQNYTPLRARQGWKEYPDLVAQVRSMLEASGVPWCIENVPGAPLNHWITLCGGMFGLRTYRHRRFETSWLIFQPPHPKHVIKTSTKKRWKGFNAWMHISITGDVGTYVGPACMGIDWMSGDELSQAIPPAYSEFIGKQAIAYIQGTEAAA